MRFQAVGHAISFVLATSLSMFGKEERLEFQQDGKLRFAWQVTPLANPQGGEKFAASAFIHPLSTPGGFPCTTLQPSDHLHHLGIWWPWKFIEVNGKKFNTWEVQEGQGAHVARSVKPLSNKPGRAQWEFINETIFKPKDAAPVVAIHETTQIALTADADATVLDISIQQKAAGSPVTISAYRYSGFSWRGPATWNKENSTMTTSGGKNREDANGTPARWVVVSGPTPMGTASLLILSAAAKTAGTPEKIRVWNASAHHGTPFVNFNPVMDKSLPLDDATPSVSKRS
jgi:hypothetical protein